MDELILWGIAAAIAWWAYRYGKRFGSQCGYRAGRRADRNNGRTYRRR